MNDANKGTKDRKIAFMKNYTNENILKGEIMFVNIFVLWSIQIGKSFNLTYLYAKIVRRAKF
jgi:hypothetical protein